MDELLALEEWEAKYDPIQNTEGQEITYETYESEDMFAHASKLAVKYNSKPYQHIWTRVDGDSGKLILLNGLHLVNRLDFILCKQPWGSNQESDKDIYIEVTYED